MGVAAVLVVAALVVVVLGFALEADSDSALLFPVGEPAPLPTTPATVPTAESPVVETAEEAPQVVATETFDPFGDGEERDRDVDLLTDGSLETTWRTERYFDPLQLLKPGVGVVFGVEGTTGAIAIDGSPGTAVVVAWSEARPSAFDDWDQVGSAVLGSGTTTIAVDSREGGSWLVWLTEVPPQDGGEYYYAVLSEVRFAS